MPRKLKQEREKQKHLIPVRVTRTELVIITRAANLAHLPTATYARLAALSRAETTGNQN